MLSRKSFIIFANKIISFLTGYIGLFFIARYMVRPDYHYGIVGFALGIVGLTGVLRTFFDRAHIKRISEGEDEGKCMGTYISLRTFLITFSVGLIYVGILIWKNILGRGFQTPVHEHVIYIILLYTLIRQVGGIVLQTSLAKKEIIKSETLRFMDESVPTVFIIFIAVTGGQAIEYAYTYVAGGCLISLLGVFFIKDLKVKIPDWETIKSYWEFGLPSFISNSIVMLGNKVDIVLVGFFWGSSNVGFYLAGRRLALVVNGLAMGVSQVIFPTISEEHSSKNWKKIRELVKESSRYLTIFIAPPVIFLIFFTEDVIRIMLSNAFIPAAPVIRILAINSFFVAFSSPISNVLEGIDKPKLGAKISVFANLVNVSLNMILIPDSLFNIPLFGLKEIGAAIATLTATLLNFGIRIVISKKEAGTEIPYSSVLHIIAALLGVLIVYEIEYFLLPLTRFYDLIGLAMLVVGIYLLVLYVLGEFRKEEWNLIMDTINPKEIIKDFKRELLGKK